MMKNSKNSINNTVKTKYNETDIEKSSGRSTDINILLNRVKLNQKYETKKKFYFFSAASTGLIIFGLIVFS
tara:strand:- start:278 stop:490 length:213 start_codon:yes stop_codon:yes gene_type:complete